MISSVGFVVLVAAFFSAVAGTSMATDYQVTDQSGFDQLNSIDFEPGDRILLAGGMTFAGRLFLGPSDSGTDAEGNFIAPIIVTSFGEGRATIAAGNGGAILAYNNGGIEISRLNLVGSGVSADGTTTNTESGLTFYADSPGGMKYQHLRVDEVDASGFGSRGVVVGGYNGDSGYQDVRITRVAVHDNLHCGIETFGFPGSTAALSGVVVSGCVADHQPGDPDGDGNTGSGIVLGGVTGGLIEHCEAHDNGANNTAAEGPVGIWTYSSKQIVIQHNESHHNTTNNGDGGGFDLDIKVTGSTVQYNYSHDNSGAGVLVYGQGGSGANTGNVVRYNVSENDGRDPGSAAASGICVFGNVSELNIYGNTVLMAAPVGNTSVPAMKVRASGYDPDEILISNNIFVTTGSSRLLYCDSDEEVIFAGNDYWPSGDSFVVRYDGKTYGSLASWRSSTGQEKSGGQATGFSVDPRFQGSSLIPTSLLGSPGLSLIAFKLRPDSPLIDHGLDLKARFGIDPGPLDLFGSAVKQGAGQEIGANEFAIEPPAILGITFEPGTPRVVIRYQSEMGVAFGVHHSPDLLGDPATDWAALPPTETGDGSVKEHTEIPPEGASRFYVLVRE